MENLLSNVAAILGMFGAIAFFVLLAILIYKLIMYKESSTKRSEFMSGIVNLIVGLVIIGLMVTIVEMIYYYIQQLQPTFTTAAVQANSDTMKNIMSKLNTQTSGGSFLAGIIADLINVLVKSIYGLFGITNINKLLMPNCASIFTSQQWTMIMGGYIILIIPAILLMLFMVFKTGLKFMLGGVNPKSGAEARSDMLRWVVVLILIVTGPIIIKGIVIIGTEFTIYLNAQLQTIMPNFDFQVTYFTGANLSNGLLGAIIQMYLLYITIRFNIIFIIRDMILIAFTVFTPIAVTLWGIDSNIVSLKVWFGEIVTNALLAFCLSIGFLTFSLVFTIFNMNGAGAGKMLLVVLVGLTMILKIGSTLRNSTQGFLFKFEGINEDKISRNLAGGGALATVGAMAMRGAGAKILGSVATNGVNNLKNKIEDSNFERAEAGVKEDFKMNDSAKAAGNVSDFIMQDARNKGIDVNPGSLFSKGKNGSIKKLSNEAIGANFSDALKDNMKNGNFSNRKDAAREAKNKTISDIAKQYANDAELQKTMPEGLTPAQQKDWFNKKAENKFAEAVTGDSRPVNYAYQKDGKEYFDPSQAGNDDNLAAEIQLAQQEHMQESKMARANMNEAYQDVAKGRVNNFNSNMQDSISDFSQEDRYFDPTAKATTVNSSAENDSHINSHTSSFESANSYPSSSASSFENDNSNVNSSASSFGSANSYPSSSASSFEGDKGYVNSSTSSFGSDNSHVNSNSSNNSSSNNSFNKKNINVQETTTEKTSIGRDTVDVDTDRMNHDEEEHRF